jgi:Domain of unknown function (DUF4167)
MKPGPNKNRSRGRNNPRRPNNNPNHNHNNRNQVFESNGPEVRIRGTVNQVLEKYLALARDASSSGDYVSAENFFQHAEHYYRILSANGGQHGGSPRFPQQGPMPPRNPNQPPQPGAQPDSGPAAPQSQNGNGSAPHGAVSNSGAAPEGGDTETESSEPVPEAN